MYPATCPASIRSVAFLHASQLFNLSLSLCLSLSVSAPPPHLRLCSVLLWKPRHLLYFKDVFVSLAAYPSDWAPRQRDAVWKMPSVSGEGGEPALSVRFLQTRSLRGDDSWRNALLILPNAGHVRVVWAASRQGEKNNVCVVYHMQAAVACVCRNMRSILHHGAQTVPRRVAFL